MSLTESCIKALGDKQYEKRKIAALEIEKLVQEFNKNKNSIQIKKLIETFVSSFLTSKDPNKRKGGLIALASTSIALGRDTEQYIYEIVNPILNCLVDPDTRVRYFASESLYNVVKVSRQSIIPVFPDIFSALSRLVTDPDMSVKNASELLDRLLKDIVSESTQLFDLTSFVPLLRERVLTKNSFARQFIISWISILTAVPEINMVFYLPDILDGLFGMLDDQLLEITRMCETLLQHFLKNIKNDPSSADLPRMTNILIFHAQNSNNELVQFIAITWLKEFVYISGPVMLTYSSGIFTAILPCLAYEAESKKNIQECAKAVNKAMLELVSHKDANTLKNLDLESVVEVLKQYLVNSSVNTKVTSLRWIHHLFTEVQDEMSNHASKLFPVLLNILNDSADEVVLEGLKVMAEIIVKSTKERDDDYNELKYREFLVSLLKMFNDDKVFLETRGSLIIRQLCVLLNSEYIYRTFAEILSEEKMNVKFVSVMVRILNVILMTSSELFDLRFMLRNIKDPKSAALFEKLYNCWVFCPISTLCLTLLANCYQHASQLVVIFGNQDITLDFLVEIDKLIQLIESPVFASLRLTLISNSPDAEHLRRSLFGILMLIPQTEAFILLKNRLQCIPNSCLCNNAQERISKTAVCAENQSSIDFEKLQGRFMEVQQKKKAYSNSVFKNF